MSQIDRAAKAIFLEAGPLSTHDAEDVAQALADAGLLAPELPAPDYTGSITEWMEDDPVLTVTAHSILGVSLIAEEHAQGIGPAEVNLTVEGARKVAAALLAAAAWAEKHE